MSKSGDSKSSDGAVIIVLGVALVAISGALIYKDY